MWNDASFHALLAQCPQLGQALEHLPQNLGAKAFDAQAGIESLASAYKDHGYGFLFYALARAFKPAACVELGVYQGFSLLATAAALRDNARGTIEGFDLFEDYPFRHESFARVSSSIRANGLESRARIHKADALQAHEAFAAVDWLHVDISNNGDIYRGIFERWSPKVARVMLLEGGSAERDRVDWMTQFDKAPIAPAIEELRRACPEWTIAVLAPFPSLTVAVRRQPVGPKTQ